MQQNNTHLIVGRFGGVYGIKGWLRISSFTRPSDNIFSYSPWLLELNGSWKEISLEEFEKHSAEITDHSLSVFCLRSIGPQPGYFGTTAKDQVTGG